MKPFTALGATVSALILFQATNPAWATETQASQNHTVTSTAFSGGGCSRNTTSLMGTADKMGSTLVFSKFAAHFDPNDPKATNKKMSCRAAYQVTPATGKQLGRLQVIATGMSSLMGDSVGSVKVSVYVQNRPAFYGEPFKVEKGSRMIVVSNHDVDLGGGQQPKDVIINLEVEVTDPRPADTFPSTINIDTLDVAALNNDQKSGIL